MPAKSRRKRGKTPPPSKRKKLGVINPPAAVQQQAAVQNIESATIPDTPVIPKAKPAPVKPQIVRYPYINSELWNIGILAVIMLVILTVLAFVIS